jgi:predicted nucleic acid-binding protein
LSTLVVDANVAMAAGTSKNGFSALADSDLVAPPLLWPEVRSSLHVASERGVIARATAEDGLRALESGAIKERRHPRLGQETWDIADELGWAKTYDAEYLALAKLLQAPLATLDQRMARAAERLGLQLDERLS